MKVEVTILGSGTSQGVPVIACDCKVCSSPDPKDKRLRTSILFRVGGENYVIDTGPDFRQQMLRENVRSLRGVIFTHEHKDHVAGMDDIRAFNFHEKRDMEIYCNANVELALRNEFHYIFSKFRYPGVPMVNINLIENQAFLLPNKVKILPVEVMHYELPVFAYRIGNFVYITDAKSVSEPERQKIRNCDTLIVNALHLKEHISHFNLEEALAFIKDINPRIAYLTHISHQFGRHDEISAMLPPNVFPAYDGLKFISE